MSAEPSSYPIRLLRRDRAAAFCGVSPTTFDTWIALGHVPGGHRVGGVVVWDVRKLDLAIDRLLYGVASNENLVDSGGAARSVWDD